MTVVALSAGVASLRAQLSGFEHPLGPVATTSLAATLILEFILALLVVLGILGLKRLMHRSDSVGTSSTTPAAADWAGAEVPSAENGAETSESFARWIEGLEPTYDDGYQSLQSTAVASINGDGGTGPNPVVAFASESAADIIGELSAGPTDEQRHERAGDEGSKPKTQRRRGPFEADIAPAATPEEVADRLRRDAEADVLDHHEAARRLVTELRRESEEEISRLVADFKSEQQAIREDSAQLRIEAARRLASARQEAEQLIAAAVTRSAAIEENTRETPYHRRTGFGTVTTADHEAEDPVTWALSSDRQIEPELISESSEWPRRRELRAPHVLE